MAKKTLTIKDIAARAGVSIGTVSRVLNDAGNVDPEMRERTRAVIARTGYRPKEAARRMRRQAGWSGAIRLVTPEIDASWNANPMYGAMVGGVRAACLAERVDLRLGGMDGVRRDGAGDGILVKSWFLDPAMVAGLRGSGGALVAFLSRPVADVDVVNVDDRLAIQTAIAHLRERGHRRIAFLAEHLEHPSFAERAGSYAQAMLASGDFRQDWLVTGGGTWNASVQEGFPVLDAAVSRLLACDPRPTAVIAANDWAAGGIYDACRRLGVRIPDDLSVVGCDDLGPLCTTLRPALTSLTVPFAEVSGLAARLLIASLRGEREGEQPTLRLLPCRLTARDSVRDLR